MPIHLTDFSKPPVGHSISEIKPRFEVVLEKCKHLFDSGNPVPKADANKLLDELDILFGVDPKTGPLTEGMDIFSQRYLHHRALARSMLGAMVDRSFLEVDSMEWAATLYFFERLAVFFGSDIESLPEIAGDPRTVDQMRAAFVSHISKTIGRERIRQDDRRRKDERDE